MTSTDPAPGDRTTDQGPPPPAEEPPGASGGALLVTVSGVDRPGIAADLFGVLAGCGARVVDVEQITILGRLLLAVVVTDADPAAVARCVVPVGPRWSVVVEVTPVASPDAAPAGPGRGVPDAATPDAAPAGPGTGVAAPPGDGASGTSVPAGPGAPDAGPTPVPGGEGRQLVTVLATRLPASSLAPVFAAITGAGATVERIVRLAHTPVFSYELLVRGGTAEDLRRGLSAAAADLGLDVAVQRAGLHRRARHLIVLDVDSTLVQGEVVDLLAERAGCADEVAAITAAAMAGELDFEQSLRRRVALLAGLPATVLDEVRRSLVLTPGARTLVRTLSRLGYETAVVSGGFTQVIEPVAAELGIGRVAANVLEVVDDRLTGGLVGPVVDRAGKAAALRRFAAEAGIPLARTVAVGDGANDVDMLTVAGLGIAFNAKAVVRNVADAAVNVPYLDTILYLLGVPRSEVEAADAGERPD